MHFIKSARSLMLVPLLALLLATDHAVAGTDRQTLNTRSVTSAPDKKPTRLVTQQKTERSGCAAGAKKKDKKKDKGKGTKESGEKGGTEDINIGVGELQEC